MISLFVLDDDRVQIDARAEGPGGIVGDAHVIIGPGEEAFGFTYDEARRLAPGTFFYEDDGTRRRVD